MIRVLFLDADGVAITGGKRFSSRFIHDFGVPEEKLSVFFETDFPPCLLGQKDLRTELEKHTLDWGWDKSVDELLEYWFRDDSVKNFQVLQFTDELRKQGTQVYLVSNQEKYRAQYLWNSLKLTEHFDGHFFSCDLGLKKSSRGFFDKVLAAMNGMAPSGIVFWDDDEENVDAAKTTGIQAFFYDDFDHFISQMEGLLK